MLNVGYFYDTLLLLIYICLKHVFKDQIKILKV